MAYILSISNKTKRPECELEDIVAVYDFPPTATEKEIFTVTEVAKIKANEIMEEIAKESDPEKEYAKFRGNLDSLTTSDYNKLKDSKTPIAEIRTILKKIRIKEPTEKK